MTRSAPFCELLPWDSEFFGMPIARVNGTDPAELVGADDWCRAQRVSVAYLQLPVAEPSPLRAAEELGFRYVDIRLELSLTRARHAPADRADAAGATKVRAHRPDDLPALERIASSAHHDSRFYADGRFPAERCDELYRTWIRRDCTEPARRVLVAEHLGETAGYLSFHFAEGDGGNRAVIDLVAVHEEHRGAGVGRALVAAGIEETLRGAPSVMVATQGRNLGAQNLYLRAGMSTTALAVWFHKWYE